MQNFIAEDEISKEILNQDIADCCCTQAKVSEQLWWDQRNAYKLI